MRKLSFFGLAYRGVKVRLSLDTTQTLRRFEFVLCTSTPEPPFGLELFAMLNYSEYFTFLDSLLALFPSPIPHTSPVDPS